MNRISETFNLLLNEGALLETSQFLLRASMTAEELTSLLQAGRIFCVEVDSVRAYPAFFLSKLYSRDDLEQVTKALGDLSGGAKWLFFTAPKHSLTTGVGDTERLRSPLDALREGDADRVTRMAPGYAER